MFGIPLEYLMFGGIGFCLAWLTALMVIPAVHNRAVRLARARFEDLPLSMQEIRAEKDTIRAGFAAATRDLELKIDKLKDRTVAHATDLAKKNQLVDRLKQEIEAITAALRESEAREQSARNELREVRREYSGTDATLGAAEGEITVLQRDLARKDAALRAADRDVASLREELSARDITLRTLQQDIASLRSELSAREAGHGAAGSGGKHAARESFEAEIAELKRELAARNATLQSGERELAALRAELASKDSALNGAETEIAAIKAEIAALTSLLVQTENDAPEKHAHQGRRVDVVPFAAPSRPIAPQSQPIEPKPVRTDPKVATAEPKAPRPPLDVIPVPSRLIPPTIPPAPQQDDDSIRRAWTEINEAARRLDERSDGPNQRLRATYGPFVKNTP